jgi:tyrosine-protein kinase Etk/Wzc
MSEQLNETVQQHSTGKEKSDEIHLLDFVIVLARHKKLVIGLPVVIGLIALVISLVMTPIFTGTAKILPPQQQSSGLAAAMLGQIGGLAGAASSIAGLKNPNDLYVGMLESRTISDNLITRFKLMERYDANTLDEARISLSKISNFENSKKDGLISVSVEDKDPQFAADLANAYIEELTKLTKTLAISDASRRRFFFEKHLKDAKRQLAEAEVALRETQEKTGMIQPEGQLQVLFSSIAQIKGMIAAKEVQIGAMQTFASSQNPDLMRAQEELRGLQAQVTKLEKKQSKSGSEFLVPTGKIPEIGIEYIRRVREVKYYETLFEMLAKQYEIAKVDESKDVSEIQILDKAIPAERKTKPKRLLITIICLIGGGALGVLMAFAKETYIRSRNNPQNLGRWNEIFPVKGKN